MIWNIRILMNNIKTLNSNLNNRAYVVENWRSINKLTVEEWKDSTTWYGLLFTPTNNKHYHWHDLHSNQIPIHKPAIPTPESLSTILHEDNNIIEKQKSKAIAVICLQHFPYECWKYWSLQALAREQKHQQQLQVNVQVSQGIHGQDIHG